MGNTMCLIMQMNLVCDKTFSLLLLWLFCSLLSLGSSEQDFTTEAQGEEIEDVRVVIGYNATLPCNVRAPDHDAPTLTLWYIADEEAPVYSYDERPGLRGSQWSDQQVFGSRAFYQAHGSPPALLLAHATVADGRLYRCRVDFQNTRSRVAWVNLTIVVPPAKVEVISRVSPVKLGDRNDVICKAYGGSPTPQVLWLQNGREVDSTYTNTGRETYNVLEVEATRGDLTSPFLCRATNNDRTGPDEVEYLRNVTSGPLSVSITGEEEPIAAGRTATLTCTVVGSNPPALVTWYQQGQMVKPLHTMVSHRDNITRSVLSLNSSRSDHGRQLVCRAVNQLTPSGALEDIFTLDVQYKPMVKMTLGRSLDPDDLREGNDLFFECNIDANPDPYKVEWWHDGELVTHNVSAGFLVSESTLALQKVQRERSGQYQCSASNVEGDTASEPVNITIKYAPRCSVSPSLRGVGLRELLNVTCQVDADPPDVTFSWTFNNSVRREQSEVVGSNRYTTERLRSVLFYTPTSERDYGTLLCYASNSVGTQRTPCSFTVISAGPPEEVLGCTIDNVTSHSCNIVCSPGFNGGLPQVFLLQIWKEEPPKPDELVVNLTRTQPEFLIRSLEAGNHYRAQVTSHNARGAAPPVTLYIDTLKEAQMHKSLPSRSEPSPLMLVLAVIGGALLVVVVLLMGVWAARGRRRHAHAQREDVQIPMKESNPDILEAAPPPSSSTHTISISIIKQPHQTYDAEPPSSDGGEEPLGMSMGLRPTVPSQKTSFGVSEPLHRPIEKSLQTHVCHTYDDVPPSSPEVTERTQLTASSIEPSIGVTLGAEGATRASRRLPYSRTPVYEELDLESSSCVRQPLMLGSSESVM